MASCARRIASSTIDPAALEAYVACRLIPLDKQPGVRPIGIGEVVRRIIGKAILQIIGPAVERATGCLQLCGGQECGIEAAIHAMRSAYERNDVHGVIFADASNAFNRLNREVCLRNVQRLCPELAPALINTYRSPAQLFVDGEVILSGEGTTQGDPLAMPMYALGTLPLIDESSESGALQSWYADDATAAATLQRLRRWWDILQQRGSSYGYYLNASKSVLLVKPGYEAVAQDLFGDTDILIRYDGYRHLGAALGTPSFVEEYITNKIDGWCKEVKKLASFAHTQPQAAYATLTHGLRHRWSFLARTVPNTGPLFEPLESVITQHLIPALLGRSPPGEIERDILSLPCRLGGMGIISPVSLSAQFASSINITEALVSNILEQNTSMDGISQETSRPKTRARAESRRGEEAHAKEILSHAERDLQRCVELAAEKGASNWLTCRPLRQYGFVLHKGAFRDAVCIRYGWTPERLPQSCVCGRSFSVAHALSCPTGGYPSIRHNELRDITASLLGQVANDVCVEPILQPLTGESLAHRTAISDDGARLDVAASGVWGNRFERTFVDIRVFNPLAQSNQAQSLTATYTKHEKEKRRHYEERVREVKRAAFLPLVFSASGGQGKAASTFYKRLAMLISEKKKESFSDVMAMIGCRLGFGLVRSAVTSIRGHRPRSHAAAVKFDTSSSAAMVAAECQLHI